MVQLQDKAPGQPRSSTPCSLCDGSGWRPIQLGNGDRAVTRCECQRPKQPPVLVDGKSAAAGDER
jgi:hypothetical protein